MHSIGIIPARYNSSRFPGKPLADINGKSMIRRVYEQASKASSLSTVLVATDDQRIFDEVQSFGGEVVMTSENHSSGTERCLEAAESMDMEFDVIVNVQGDEPYIQPEQIDLVLSCFHNENTDIATLIKLIEDPSILDDPNKVKVVVDEDDFGIYFSRQCIPFLQGTERSRWNDEFNFYKHIGMYAYRYETLKEITALKPSRLERAESLEQLRWIENGYRIRTAITEEEALSVDTPEDLEKLEQMNLED